jgi:hypothetical protein
MPDNQPVGRVVSIWYDNVRSSIQDRYDHLMSQRTASGLFDSPMPAPAMRLEEILGAMVVHKRGGREIAEHAWVDMPVFLHDVFKTGYGITMAIDFIIGGRVGINHDSTVRVVTERSVEDAAFDLKRTILRKGGIFNKTEKLKQIEFIQTNGGVMGIKG